MNAEERRERRLKLLEDDIGRHLAESAASGELQRAKSYGRPLDLGDGYDETPLELRMGMKILKDAGVVPAEVALMREIEALRQSLREDQEDLAAVRSRAREKTLGYEEFLAKLKADGAI